MSDVALSSFLVPKFARHETFPPRFGWLHKAYMQVKEDEELFHRKNALVRLGVGKNMVFSMRYWSQAFKLTHEYRRATDRKQRALFAAPTWRARWLLDEDGADPYLEDTGSLWLLHWWLVSGLPERMCLAPSWYVMFHHAPLSRFTADEMDALITRMVRDSFKAKDQPAPGSISRDVECLLKMYVSSPDDNPLSPGSFEDSLLCPFKELGLIESQGGKGKGRTYRFTQGVRPSLPVPVLLYACLDYATRFTASSGSISMARLANEPGAPGQAFRMREPDLARAIEPFVNNHPNLKITEALGQRSLTFNQAPEALAWNILDEHYGRVRERPGFPTPAEWEAANPGLREESITNDSVQGQIPEQTELTKEYA